MTASAVRHRRLLLVVCAVVVLAAAAFLVASVDSYAAGAKGSAGQSVLVVRNVGDHDALWLLSPVDGTPTAVGDLPGHAGSAAASPGGVGVAYLPANGAPRVWIGYGPLGPKTISLAAAGVRRVDSLTWVDDHSLLVSGVTRARADLYQDRLFLVNVATGKTASFRRLRGTEPYGVPALGKVAYTQLTVVKPGTAANQHTPTIRESLRVVKLSGGTGRTLLTETYKLFADHRSFAQPQLSGDGDWLLTGTTGSDVSVTYTVRDGGGLPLFTVFTASLDVQGGWDASGRTAFAGTPLSTVDESCVWVCDPARGTIARTPPGLLPGVMVTDLNWSATGELAAGIVTWNSTPQTRHVSVISHDLDSAVDLGVGRLPVWARL